MNSSISSIQIKGGKVKVRKDVKEQPCIVLI